MKGYGWDFHFFFFFFEEKQGEIWIRGERKNGGEEIWRNMEFTTLSFIKCFHSACIQNHSLKRRGEKKEGKKEWLTRTGCSVSKTWAYLIFAFRSETDNSVIWLFRKQTWQENRSFSAFSFGWKGLYHNKKKLHKRIRP